MTFSHVIRTALMAVFSSAALLASLNTQAYDNSYMGVDILFADIEYSGAFNAENDADSLQGKIGTYFTPNLGVEGRIGIGFDDAVDHYAGVYGRGSFDFNEVIRGYALLGVTRVDATATGLGGSVSDDEFGFGYGLGVEVEFSRPFTANVEYFVPLDGDDYDLDGIALGVNYYF